MKMPAFLARSALGRCLWTFRREFLWVGVFSMFANLLMLTPTLYMLQVFDRVLVSGNELTLGGLTLVAVFFFLVMGFAEWVRSRLLVRASAALDAALSTAIFKASFEASLSGGARNPMQSLSDLTALRQFMTGTGIFAVFDTPWTPVYIAVLFMIHPWLGWAAICFTALMALMAWTGHRLTAPKHMKAQEALMECNNYLHGKLRNAETVEALGMVGSLRRQWLGLHERVMSRTAQAQDSAQRFTSVTRLVQYSQQSLTLSLGAILAMNGHIGVGAMVACNALVSNALRPFSNLVSTWKQFVDARRSYGRLEQLLDAHPERQTTHSGEALIGQVSLRELEATAKGRPTPILKGLTVDFRAGEVVAIVGPSGAGKSTLARCIVGIWPQVSGQVLLDGHPIAEWPREVLGPHIGYLPQDIELFDGSIAENIARFGDLEADRVIEAAERTGVHDMILRLPKGYDTSMGEAGNLLSGGQRQRIGLARALYGNPELVVLDEPNANLDDVGEAALVKTVQELRSQGRTVFMIVHQRHLLAVADRVLLMEDGRIKAIGPVVVEKTSLQT